ncbi:MAG: RtcB family protein [Rectinemataceae bacterium]
MPVLEIIRTQGVPVKLFANQVDEGARRQLVDLAESGIAEEFVAAMPDVHFGMGATIGSVFASSWAICPNAVGVDIGCGMAAIPFPGLIKDRLSEDMKWAIHTRIKREIPTGMSVHPTEQKGSILDDEERSSWLSRQLTGRALRSLGTLGGGNHFIEIVHDPEGKVWIMLHSGSRNLGKITAERYDGMARAGMKAKAVTPRNRDLNWLAIDSGEGREYLLDMGWCQRFALANREAMLRTIAGILEEETDSGPDWAGLVNIHHNFASLEEVRFKDASGAWVEKRLWITRKGATSARQWQKGLIPGSMAAGSWLVEGLGNWESWYSCSHGAGRSKSRTASFAEITQSSFEAAMTGIVAETVAELRDEAPQAYKDLGSVMDSQSDLVKPILRLLPLINVKGWDPAGAASWAREKIHVTFLGAGELGIEIAYVEFHGSAQAGSPASEWVAVGEFMLKPMSPAGSPKREFWVKAGEGATHRILLSCVLADASDELLSFQVQSVKKREKL